MSRVPVHCLFLVLSSSSNREGILGGPPSIWCPYIYFLPLLFSPFLTLFLVFPFPSHVFVFSPFLPVFFTPHFILYFLSPSLSVPSPSLPQLSCHPLLYTSCPRISSPSLSSPSLPLFTFLSRLAPPSPFPSQPSRPAQGSEEGRRRPPKLATHLQLSWRRVGDARDEANGQDV